LLDRENGPPWRIAVVSGVVLILELAFIRLVPAEVRVISYFTNLVLMAAFFGLGLGCILQRQRTIHWLLPSGLLLVLLFVLVGRGVLIYPESEAVHFWLQYQELEGQALHLPLVPAAMAVFLFAALPFVALGQTLARTMDEHPRLVAYGWDIAGSLAGTLIFSLASYFGVPPWLWPPVLMLLLAVTFGGSMRRRLAWVASGVVFLVLAQAPQQWRWSPYYYIRFSENPSGLQVWVNSSFHQFAIDFTAPGFRDRQQHMLEKWSVPYDAYRQIHGRTPQKVLVLGAGTGNDVYVAFANEAREVVAVEIDPVILELGEEHNRTRPYDDRRVRTYVDDARHFLRTSEETFDLIVLATLDSQSLLSGHANLRLENYVYTTESLVDARRLLADGGLVAVYYSVFKPWLYSRLYTTVREVFGEQSRIHLYRDPMLFNTLVMGANGVASFTDSAENVARFTRGLPATDDWPYVYLEHPTIAPVYLELFAIIGLLILGAFLLLRRLHPARGLYVHFFLLGLGFTLMESSAIVRLALVFGSTWTVNAVVFASVLSMIFAANWLVLAERAPRLALCWPSLCAAIALNYLLPVSILFEPPPVLRVLSCGLLIGAPVFFAALCFSHLFRSQEITGYPLGLNLVGAMGGGLVEYLSMLLGMRAIWMVVLVVYLLAWLATVTIRRAR
jgi:SAM-dependent methyltransferase